MGLIFNAHRLLLLLRLSSNTVNENEPVSIVNTRYLTSGNGLRPNS